MIILVVGSFYGGAALLDFDPNRLQQTGEHNESATLPLLAGVSLWRYGEIPLWNPYMLTGFPHVGDTVNHFWNPVSTLSILIWGGINGMKVSIFISFLLAGFGQWLFAHTFGLRGLTRLWVSLLFMTSGGLAMLWRVGWYELLLGMVWFPWCFATLWWALHRRDRTSVALAALCIVMVLSSGGGYYPFYLFVSLSVLVGMRLILTPSGERASRLRRAVAIAGLSAGLLAVMIVPLIDGARFTQRQTLYDLDQRGSQSIPYALVNYMVGEPGWLDATILGNGGGYNWFYIGVLPMAALAVIPLALGSRSQRPFIVALAVLLLVLLAWHANRHFPVRILYDWMPWLYKLRFPGRLLVLAASPLLVLSGLGLQYILEKARTWSRNIAITFTAREGTPSGSNLSLYWLADVVLALILFISARDVFTTNKAMAFAPGVIDPKSFTALTWLKQYDPSLYYTNIGGVFIYYQWTPAAYSLEMPLVNFKYNRQMATEYNQFQPGSPFFAKPKYMLVPPGTELPEHALLLHDFDGMVLWQLPDALPYAFSTPAGLLRSGRSITPGDVTPIEVHLDGPNRIIARASGLSEDSQLVILVSDYPGWRLSVDGNPAPVVPSNAYLGARMLPGDHVYTFEFLPSQYIIGLSISLLSLVIALGLLLSDLPIWARRKASARLTRRGYRSDAAESEQPVDS